MMIAYARSGVNKVDVDIDIVVCCCSTHNGANALCGTTAAANDTPKIARTNANFKKNLVALARTR
jgi:hypothetical protein